MMNKSSGKILITIFFLFLSSTSYTQIKQRTNDISVYTAVGYKFIFLTDPTASDAYPFFDISDGNFMRELCGYLGVTITERLSVEFSPAYLYNNKIGSDGFYFENNTGNNFYYPQISRLFAVPLNLRIKFFPFAKNYTSFASKLYIGGGGGAMYIDEEMTNDIYREEGRLTYLGTRTFKNDFWTSDFEIIAGVNSFSKIGFGFELSYRFVPLNQPHNLPLITSLAGNFNSANLSANVIYSF